MEIHFHSSFRRMYRKFEEEQKQRVDAAIQLFARDPFHPALRNHKLKGPQEGAWSFSAGYDLRILYVNESDVIVLLLKVGTHEEVY